ncbi:hypothetical protein VE03_06684 [Pseudogymnoascus sp. 23342-1-I1]|nr:hypothetical protein VE03_06684 [Pseudogymnoascus sp. 23342-1-I1]
MAENTSEQIQCFVFITFFHNCGHTSTRKHCRDQLKIWADGTHKHPHAACDDNCAYMLPYYAYMWELSCTWCRQQPRIPRTAEERSDMPDPGHPDLPLTTIKIIQRRHAFLCMMRIQREGQRRLIPYEVDPTGAPRDVLLDMLIRHDSEIVINRLTEDVNRVPISDRIYEVGALCDHSELFTYVDARTYPDIHEDNCGICITSINTNSIRQLPCGHMYHLLCIYEWFGRSNPRTCPTCRQVYNIIVRQDAATAEETEADLDAAAILFNLPNE